MPWTSCVKSLPITGKTAHVNSSPGVIGRAPVITTFDFTPLEFYGAAARCSHMHLVNPSLATPESQIVTALVEQHVDNTSPDFAILSSAARFKDFVKSYFSGTVATGLAYLSMVRDGYTWSDHFENLGGGNPALARTPDFVFAATNLGTALVESKGTRKNGSPAAYDRKIDAGYRDQVEPHLGYTVGTATATHGYCIGAWMTSPIKAEMLVHHTEVPPASGGGGGGGDDSGSLTALQQHNYATAFHLALGSELGEQLRGGRIETVAPLSRFHWLGRSWLTGSPDLSPRFGNRRHLRFAVEDSVATAVVRHFFQPQQPARIRGLDPLSPELRNRARNNVQQPGAVFPDGLALIDLNKSAPDMHRVIWRDGEFVAGNT